MRKGKGARRAVAIVLAFVSAAALVVAALGPAWLVDPDHDRGGFGLRTVKECIGSDCKTQSVGDLLDEIDAKIKSTEELNATLPVQQQLTLPRKPWHGFAVVGTIAFIACFVAAVGLFGGAVLALAGKRPELPIMPTTLGVLGLIIALINGCIFVATKPAAVDTMEVGWTFLTFGGAIVTGLASVFPLNRLIRPIDHELGEASATMSWGESRDDE